TLDGLFSERSRRSPDEEAYRAFERHRKSWESLTWGQMRNEVGRWQAALRDEGLKPGDRVGIQLRNCPQWVMFEQAALSLGLVVVPLYTDDRPDNVAYIVDDASIRLMLIQDTGRWKRLAPVVDPEGPLQRVLLLEESADTDKFLRNDSRVRSVPRWLREGVYTPRSSRRASDLATIVYTSGTTGRPKGVMLSHANILFVAHSGLTMINVYRQDAFLSFLPLSHTLERTVGYYIPMMTGSSVIYSRSTIQLADDLATQKPTIIISVPRVFEKVYGKLQEQLSKGPKIKKLLFNKAVSTGWKKFEHEQGRASWGPSLLIQPLLDRLVGSKVREKLGGRLRLAVLGGAALPPPVARVFIGLGIPMLQGYGLTETSPALTFNTFRSNIPESVGIPLRGVELRLGENDELLAKSPGVMLGYWNNHKATAEILGSDGWLHTGDVARIDRHGHVYITGRIKDILVLSNGEKIPPGDMESEIAMDAMFEQVMVIGEARPYLSALIVVNELFWSVYAPGLPYSFEELQKPEVIRDATNRVKRALKDFPGYAKIRKIALLAEPWTIDND
ncbi:MAG: long-chain fatty acid--CoA ligase, partial [Sedimenticolaceae bacterium]|nr:long-chain fatty acid--CoA ligase [Sedimenticolaceae bacterium]